MRQAGRDLRRIGKGFIIQMWNGLGVNATTPISTVRRNEKMKGEVTKPLIVSCSDCGFANVFNQPYAYHARFGDQGFLYNEAGNCTLMWSSFDPDYEAIVGKKNPWSLTDSD